MLGHACLTTSTMVGQKQPHDGHWHAQMLVSKELPLDATAMIFWATIGRDEDRTHQSE